MNSMPTDLQAQAERLLDDLCRQHPIGYRPALLWKNLRVTAGVAYFRAGSIALSRLILVDEERLSVTLRHEYAHLMAFVRHGRKGCGHGETWKAAMRELGLEPTVRHKYEVQRNLARQEVAYACQKCGATITRRRKLPRRRHYVHANCGGALKLRSVHPITSTPG